jgi:sarcosine oxidase subunit gamma
MTIAPHSLPRRSFVYRKLEAAGAVFETLGDAALAMRLAGEDPAVARQLALCDLSPLPRLGFKGARTLAWLRAQGVALDERANQAFAQPGGGLCAVLAPGEALLLAPLSGRDAAIERLAATWSIAGAEACYPVPRQDSHFWFLVSGRQAPAMFAKICGVDLRPGKFADLGIAQTSVARGNCVVLRADRGGTLAYHLLGDSASAEYMWDCVIDAMAEFRGRPVGVTAVRSLLAQG